MSKKALLMVSLCLFAFTTTTYGSNFLEVYKFTVKIFFNGQQKALPEGYEILNYKGRTYIPLRYFAEATGNGVTFDPVSKEVHYYQLDHHSFAEHVAAMENKDFRLEVLSAKKEYKQGELLQISAEATYLGKDSVEVTHTTPALRYIIDNNQGFRKEELTFSLEKVTTFYPNSKLRAALTPATLQIYNYQLNQKTIADYEANVLEDPYFLNPGNYEITYVMDYEIHNTRESISVTLPVIIK